MIENNLLYLLTISVVVGVPVYLNFRERMVTNQKDIKKHSKRRVIKLTFINFGLNLVIALFFSTFMLLMLRKVGFVLNNTLMVLVISYFVIIWLTFYGNGIYITSIILEDFTLPQLKSIKAYGTQFIATQPFHGPISHTLIYSGWILVFLILSILNIYLPYTMQANRPIYILIAGGILGIFYAVGQIYNGTAIYHFFTALFSSVVIIKLLLVNDVGINTIPITSYFIGFLASFVSVLAVYLLFIIIFRKQKGHVKWDTSGNSYES